MGDGIFMGSAAAKEVSWHKNGTMPLAAMMRFKNTDYKCVVQGLCETMPNDSR